MTVQEYFRSLDKEKFIKEYIDYSNYYRSTTKKNILRDLLFKLDSLEIVSNPSKIIFSVPVPDSESRLLDSFCINKEDLYKEDRVEHYAYEMTSMQEILGYQISQACNYFLGEYRFACSILYEMTFFGYDVVRQEKEVTQLSDKLKEQVEEIESGSAKLASVENLFEHFGFEDNRSEAEKLFDSEKFTIDGVYSKKITEALFNLEKDYL